MRPTRIPSGVTRRLRRACTQTMMLARVAEDADRVDTELLDGAILNLALARRELKEEAERENLHELQPSP